MSLASKDPAKVAAGQIGARARWGDERRIVRLDALTPPQRALVVALVENMGTEKGAPAAVAETPQEVRSASSTTTSES